jgi:adenosine/AMP kinase
MTNLDLNLQAVPFHLPEGANMILGQSHFIKTAEDIYEAMVNAVPGIKFGVAFSEASGPCLIRAEGNDEVLVREAVGNARRIAAGHTFVVLMRDAFPINVLGRIKDVPEVCTIFCASANPVQVLVAQSEQGRGIVGVIDGFCPKGVEGDEDKTARHTFLRKIGYKR